MSAPSASGETGENDICTGWRPAAASAETTSDAMAWIARTCATVETPGPATYLSVSAVRRKYEMSGCRSPGTSPGEKMGFRISGYCR